MSFFSANISRILTQISWGSGADNEPRHISQYAPDTFPGHLASIRDLTDKFLPPHSRRMNPWHDHPWDKQDQV